MMNGKIKNIPLHDKRMLLIMKYVVDNNLKGVFTDKDFCKSIGYQHASNLTLVRNGLQSFRVKHITRCCELYGIDANFFIFSKHTNMFREGRGVRPMMQLKEAVQVISMELNK